MANDALTKNGVCAALGAHPWASRLIVLREVDSTNRYLKQLASEGAPEGTAVLADCQMAGRGRLGRSFHSPAGCGIYLSVLLRPELPPDRLLALTALCADATRCAIAEVCHVSVQIKWVNDLLLNGKKICGILTELTLDGAQTDFAVVGIGINCNETGFPDTLPMAGSILTQTGRTVDRAALCAALLRQFYELRTQLAEPRSRLEQYRQHCMTLSRQVRIGDKTALALSVGDNAALTVQYPDGTQDVIQSGEVSVRALDGYI